MVEHAECAARGFGDSLEKVYDMAEDQAFEQKQGSKNYLPFYQTASGAVWLVFITGEEG